MLLFLLACPGQDAGADSASTFVAMQSDFADFATWDRTSVPGSETGTGHGATSKSVYLNFLPEDGATEFAVGTMLVKVTPVDDGRAIHAMVKRGGGYNAEGAVDWEFFELVMADDGVTPVIDWRGIEPPFGSGYLCVIDEGDTAVVADCNGCHMAGSGNDFVHSIPL